MKMESKKVLDLLSEKQIFEIREDWSGAEEKCFIELCDGYYSCYLNKNQILQLAKELTDMANQMPSPLNPEQNG